MFLQLLLTVICFSSEALSHSLFKPCNSEDYKCLVMEILPKLISGVPSLGVESSDPLFVEKIEGDLSMLKYKFLNVTITGLKNCVPKNVKLDKQFTSLYYDLHCDHIEGVGKYELDGLLIDQPVRGNGNASIITGKYFVTIDAELKRIDGSDGKMYVQFKNFKLNCQPLESIKFDFTNLFDGQQDLSDSIHDFAHQNWEVVAGLFQEPLWYSVTKKVYSNFNKYLNQVPLHELFILEENLN